MPLRKVVLAMVALAFVAGIGCSRLTFVKPKFKRDFHQTGPEYTVRDDPRDVQRIAAIDQVALAEQGLRSGQLDDAETHARAAIKADPASADAYTMLAMVQEQRGSEDKAGQMYAKAMSLAPGKGVVLNNYGAWLCRSGQAAASIALFDRALADPGYSTPGSALANAGACAVKAGQGELASQYLGKALEMDPGNAVALEAMAESEFNAGHYMEARAFSERRLAVAPASVKMLQLASQIEQKLGDTAAAARYVQRIGTEFPQQRTAPPGEAHQP